MDISPDSGFQNIISQDPVSEDVKGVVTLFIAQLRRNEVWNALSCDIFLGLLKMIAFSVSSLRRAALAVPHAAPPAPHPRLMIRWRGLTVRFLRLTMPPTAL
jgi:hypothetical protein